MRVFSIFLFGLLANSATAATVTFSEIPAGDGVTADYTEDGVTVSPNGGLGSLTVSEAAYLADGGTGYASELIFTMSTRFDAASFDLRPLSFDNFLYFEEEDDQGELVSSTSLSNVEFENVLVQGFRDGAVVASDQFNMLDFPAFSFATFTLNGFSNIDALSIGFALQPTSDDFAGPPGTTFTDFTCDAPCSRYNLDNVVLNPVVAVPLPSGLPLAFLGLGALGMTRLRRRR